MTPSKEIKEKKGVKREKKMSSSSRVVRDLKEFYSAKLLPIEKSCLFHKFHSPELLDSELSSKPTILLLGQYSTGKTTFIQQLIGMDYPEIHIGPEPTTDKFIAVVHGQQQRVIKGNALTGLNDLPFAGLSVFGAGFLNKFTAAVTPSPLLRKVNIIDTPGVLSGEKQRTSRGYDFAKVAKWFAARSDLILLMFDPSKLDISDELKSVIEELQPFEEKVCCVLNKADNLDTESLIRVYGALLWSMGKVFRGAEVTRVFVGSFQDKEPTHQELKGLFGQDKKELMCRIEELPKACAMRKVNEMIKRIRLAIVNVCLLGYIKSQMPTFWGKEAAQEKLLKELVSVFEAVQRKYSLAPGDFPAVEEFKETLKLADFSSFPSVSRSTLASLQSMLTEDMPRIMAALNAITRWVPDDDEEEGDEDDDEDMAENGDDKLDGVQKHVNIVTFVEDKPGAQLSTAGLLAIFVGLFAILLGILSYNESHATTHRYFSAAREYIHNLTKN